MRASIVIAVVLGCGGSKTEAPGSGSGSAEPVAKAGSGSGSSGSGSAAPAPAKGVCLSTDSSRGIESFTADDKTATICTAEIGEGDKDLTCVAVDLATGVWSAATKPTPPKPAAKPPTPDVEIKQDKTAVSVCKAGVCKKLAVPPPKIEESRDVGYLAVASDDGKRAVLAGDDLKGAWFFDATTGKKLLALPLTADGGCMDTVAFVGDLVYIAVNVCAGPGAQGKFYSWDGKVVAKLENVNPYGAEPIHLTGDEYAFADLNGDAIGVFDAKTKKSRTLEIPRVECDDCYVLGAAPLGGDVALIQVASGKLVDLMGTSVAVIDAGVTKIVAQHRIPACPVPKTKK